MLSHMDSISEINKKYMALEAEVDRKLEKVKCEEEKLLKLENEFVDKSPFNDATKIYSYEEALERNANLLKSLEMTAARLRSRSAFSPIEQILQECILNYKKALESSSKDAPTQEATCDTQSGSSVDGENEYEIVKD